MPFCFLRLHGIKRANNLIEHDGRYMRINGCGFNAGMPEELLNHLQGNALFKQVRGKTVAQGVRRNRFADACSYGGIADDLSK